MSSGEPRTGRSFLRRHAWSLGLATTLAVAILLVTALGGWEHAVPEDTTAEPGDAVAAAPFTIRLDGARATYESGGRAADPDRAYVVVEGELSLDAKKAVGITTLSRMLTTDLGPGYDGFGEAVEEIEPDFLVALDGDSLLGLGPGITYPVEVTFVVDEADVPEQVEVTLQEHLWRKSSLDQTWGWFDPVPVKTVVLDVEPLPAERPPAEDF